MIIVDIETTGIDPLKNSIVSIGAVDFETADEFYIECQAIPDREIDEYALKINGFTKEQCFDPRKPTAEEAYKKFLRWTSDNRNVILGGQQIGSFDARFLIHMHERCNLGKFPFGHRSVDLHSVAYAKFGLSLSLDAILQKLGLAPEARPHNALNGARAEYAAFKQLLAPQTAPNTPSHIYM